MKKNVFIGIDVSKEKLDIYIYGFNYHFIVSNDTKGLVKLLETSCEITECKSSNFFICFENTGKYSKMLSVFLHTQEITFIMEPALRIKKSLGMARGKNDKVDSKRIALYVYEKRESLEPTILPGEKVEKIKSLLSLREKLIKHRTAYKNGISDLNDCYQEGETKLIKDVQQRLIVNINQEIKKIENEINCIIESDLKMQNNFNLITTITGIGKINAYFLIAYTANFTLFKNARAFACYCGIAPFDNSSGKYSGNTKVHHFANKQLKTLLNMAATSAIKTNGELKEYYNKRVLVLGKNKRSTINIIRNKIVYRVFAVVSRGTPYVNLYKFAA